MAPYADFTYFGLLLYIVVPTILLGLFGRANARWALFATVVVCVVQFTDDLDAAARLASARTLGRGRLRRLADDRRARLSALEIARRLSTSRLRSALLPLAVAKYLPHLAPGSELGFPGISYVTFRALDVIFSIRDGVIKRSRRSQYFAFLFFFPTISSGPIDRYRRFIQDWQRQRNRARIPRRSRHRGASGSSAASSTSSSSPRSSAPTGSIGVDHGGGCTSSSYMYGYTFYLFFDFAGYSAFAIGFSHLFGIRTPENFNLPFLARNIRDFWNRWHIRLSFWFRDHVYMRFLLTAAKGKWFKGKHTANYLGLFLTFGLMGIWHGTESYYLIYGVYHAALLCGYDWFARWNKTAKWWPDGPVWRVVNIGSHHPRRRLRPAHLLRPSLAPCENGEGKKRTRGRHARTGHSGARAAGHSSTGRDAASEPVRRGKISSPPTSRR